MGKEAIIPDGAVISKIHLIRGHKVMLDKDLASLYNASTGNLNKAVKRNLMRFHLILCFSLPTMSSKT
jgi:hypothetical protein